MEYFKKILLLKETEGGFSLPNKIISGIARFETENGTTSLHLSLINVKSVEFGSYILYIYNGEKLISFDLGKHPTSCYFSLLDNVSLKNGLAMGICFVKDYIPVLIAFSKMEVCAVSVSQFKSIIIDNFISIRKEEAKKPVYDDEVVATENYYEEDFDKNVSQKLKLIEEIENKDNESYYEKVKEDLVSMFEKFPSEESLSDIIPNSKWIKINYSHTKYYVVGIVYEENREKYICYGVPAIYSEQPPKELSGFCSFIPVDPFKLKGEGFWMMFQDAVTGDCVKQP